MDEELIKISGDVYKRGFELNPPEHYKDHRINTNSLKPLEKYPNIQDVLKFFALISMLIDHLGLFFFHDSWIMRVIGRYAAIIFSFFVGYNYKRPESNWYFCIYKKRYRLILFWGILVHILQIITSGIYLEANILISIIINLCLVDLVKNYKIEDAAAIIFFGFFAFASYRLWDYGTFLAAIIMIGQIARISREGYVYSAILYYTIMCLLIFQYEIMDFSPLQIFIVFLIFLFICYSLLSLDFAKTVKYRVFFISRYSLSFYVIHISIIMVCSKVLGF